MKSPQAIFERQLLSALSFIRARINHTPAETQETTKKLWPGVTLNEAFTLAV